MHIDIWSDVVCPWCYLGMQRFEAALDRLGWDPEDPDSGVTVRWRAYELDPRAPREPQDLRVVLEKKYGPGSFDAMDERLTRLGDAEGIEYHFDRIQRVNTFDAHRVLAWAASLDDAARAAGDPGGHQRRMGRALFRTYFTDGADLGDPDVLAAAARAARLDGDDARRIAVGDDFADEVRGDEAAAAGRDLTGVPAFVLGDRLVIPGAQDTDTFVNALPRTRERLTAAG